ncbi:uncharacterized protein ACBR49_014631 [Aulostomus maculatus]
MGVCPLLLLLSVALGASAQDHVPVTSPPNITAKPTDPPAAPVLNVTVAVTQAPALPPTTLPLDVIPVTAITTSSTTTTTTTTTNTSPAGDEDVQVAGPNATVRLAQIPPPPPPAPTEAPQTLPNSEAPPPPTTAGTENETSAMVPDTPTPEIYCDLLVETETTTEADQVFTSYTSPHDNSPSDEMPIIAVMVALSSLLVIIFIIIILYMLRTPERASIGPFTQHKQEVPASSCGQA